jgi:hypothetical protein
MSKVKYTLKKEVNRTKLYVYLVEIRIWVTMLLYSPDLNTARMFFYYKNNREKVVWSAISAE